MSQLEFNNTVSDGCIVFLNYLFHQLFYSYLGHFNLSPLLLTYLHKYCKYFIRLFEKQIKFLTSQIPVLE